ncbi:MAG: FAD-binding protein [Desulfobacteraceae bacterium]|nr:MAG: FAD-binding protein [Desulfobacteraceae bacterium]
MRRSLEDIGHVWETDVLILGTGAAGCGAAIAAREHGVRALMVDKGRLESSGCLGGGNDHFMAVLNSGPENDSTRALVDFYKGPMSGYTEAMIESYVRAMPPILRILEEMGVEFIRNPDGSYVRTTGFGQPGNWFIEIENGWNVKRRIARKIRTMGVEILDHVMVTRLLRSGGRIAGALGYHVLDGTFHIMMANAVVLALGNSANRATTNSTGNPFNTWHSPYNTGSQFVLAYEAGARLINLDLKQQATLTPKGFGSAGMNGINSVGAFELNALGERFMGRYHPLMENGPRREQIQGTFQEMLEGKGPPFHVDMRHCDQEAVRHLQYVLMPGDKATFLDYSEQKGIDFEKHPMEVELSEIELSGMLQTDENFESTLPGLFNGCVFYSFSGSMCSGYLAGGSAAASLPPNRTPIPIDLPEAERERERVLLPLGIGEGIPYQEYESAVRQVMKYYMGYVRNRQGMELVLDRLDLIESRTDRIKADDFHGLMRANEAIHLLKTCRLSTRATLERKESGRAIYRRSDYPEKKERYNRSLALWQEQGQMRTAWL